MAPRKNTKVTKITQTTKNTKNTKNTKSASVPAPVADSKIAKVYTGRKTRAMKTAEAKAAAEAGNITGNNTVDAPVATNNTVKTVKPVVTATTVKPVKAAVTKAKAKGSTLKSAANALKALKGARKTNQDDADSNIGQSSSSVKKPTITEPAIITPTVPEPVITKPSITEPAVVESAAVKPAVVKPAVVKPAVVRPAPLEPAVPKPTVTNPVITKAAVVEPSAQDETAPIKESKPQVVIDVELNKWLIQEGKKPFWWGTQVAPVRPRDMARDFKAMGFRSAKVKELIVTKEPVKVDGLMQRPSAGSGLCVPNTGPEPPKRVRRAPGNKYQNLVVFEDKDWALFDPRKPYPEQHGEPPLSITRWARFVPGNPRIIVMNMKTQSLRSQATPESLLHHAVDYTESGPKIAGWTPIPNPKKKPSRGQPASAPSDPPLLGRGARRNAARPVVSSETVKLSSSSSGAPAPKEATTGAPKRKADEMLASEPPQLPAPASGAPAPKKPSTAAAKRKAAAPAASSEAPPPSAGAPAPKKTGTSAPKRKAADISASEPPASSSAPLATATPPPAAATKKRKTAAAASVPAAVPAPVAPPPAPVAPVVAGNKRKRRAARPKKTPAVVENSSSE